VNFQRNINSKSSVIFLVGFLLFLPEFLSAQVTYQKIFEKKYSELPFGVRVETSGNYSVASFDVGGDWVFFTSFNTKSFFTYFKNELQSETKNTTGELDFAAGIGNSSVRTFKRAAIDDPRQSALRFKKIFFANPEMLSDEDGVLSTSEGKEVVTVKVEKSQRLILQTNLNGLLRESTFDFPFNLACADFIGIDVKGNSFLLVETFVTQIPLKVKREVYTITKDGRLLSTLLLPPKKYIFTIKDLQIDGAGNLFHLYSDEHGIKIFKWTGLTTSTYPISEYPQEYFNQIVFPSVKIIEEPHTKNITGINTPASRVTALKIGESYALHQYTCKAQNLSPQNVSAPDGDVVRTPTWLVVGRNARVAYMWGGFSSLAQYDAGLQAGKYAADINTAGVSSYAVGVDCSGFVSRCWQMSYHSSTSMMPDITTQYASWNDLKPGDAIHKVGHVRLFVNRTPDGKFRVVESSARGWDVSYWTYLASDLTTYTPRYYNEMESGANASQPNLLQAVQIYGGIISLSWSCDTTGIIGYRIYHSIDGSTWSLLLDEHTCDSTSINIGTENNVEYFRIASVKNNGGILSESFWSNSMGVGATSTKKCLIVDGYKRLEGSWQGGGHTFSVKYGKALQKIAQSFESVSNTKVLDGSIQLNDYDAVFWISGDESTVDETFSRAEQTLLKNYLEAGGSLFISGSEIGWDLSAKGDAADKEFYKNYFKAIYVSDDAGSNETKGMINSVMDGCRFYFGQTYEEDYPDEINPTGGSILCMQYTNGKGSGIQYAGTFGSSAKVGKIIYLSFPLETTADDSSFNFVIAKAVDYFHSPVSATEKSSNFAKGFSLSQNYPNPFNPSTTIQYEVVGTQQVSLKIFDILGNEIATLVSERKETGVYNVDFSSAKLGSGTYVYQLRVGDFVQTKKMLLLK